MKIKKTLTYIAALTPYLLLAAPAIVDPLSTTAGTPSDIKTVFTGFLNVLQTILIMFSTLYLIYSGFMFVVAKGDPAKLKKAKDALLWGLVGSALILCAEVLANGIGDTVKDVFKSQ